MAARGILRALLVVMTAFVGPRARADDLQHACGYSEDRTFGACALHYLGSRAADDFTRRGDELIRVVVTKPERIEPALIAVEIVLPKSGDATATVRDPYLRVPPQTYRVSRALFAALRQRLLDDDHLLKAVEIGRKEGGKHGCEVERICLDPAVGFVDVVLAGEASNVYLDGCGDFWQIVQDIVDFAVRADPTCSDNFSDWWGPEVLQACLNVRGDRRLGAQGFAATETLGNALYGSDVDRKAVEEKTDSGAHLLVGNKRMAIGPSGILTWWSQITARGTVWLRPIAATGRGDKSIVTGNITQTLAASDARFTASFVQTWRKDVEGKIHLVEWRIAEFRAQ